MVNVRFLATRVGIPAVLFCVGFGLMAFLGARIGRRDGALLAGQSIKPDDIPGLSAGEIVDLPKLPRLAGGSANLGAVKQQYLLCGVFSTMCPGCAEDASLWQDLNKESEERGVAFYLISTDDDRDRVRRYAQAYEFEDLPVLYDSGGEVARKLKVSFVPQYLLFSADGKVVARWNGINRSGAAGSKRIAPSDFFAALPGGTEGK